MLARILLLKYLHLRESAIDGVHGHSIEGGSAMNFSFKRQPSPQQLFRELLRYAGDSDVLDRAIESARRESHVDYPDFETVLEHIERIHREEAPPRSSATG